MTEIKDTDIVVIGAGASGIGAALTAVEKGCGVVLLEKGNKFGGAGMFGAQGLFAVESAQQQAKHINYTVSDAFNELLEYTHYRSNAKITKKILSRSAETIDWLASNGLKTELVNNTQEPHQKHAEVYHQYIDKFNGFQKLMDNFIDRGGILLTETSGLGIITDNSGQISGVRILHEGRSSTINCKAVICADGGFIGNQEMVAKYSAVAPDVLHSMGERKATGDGIKMLEKIGGDTRHIGTFENHAATVISPTNPKWRQQSLFTLTNIPLLWIDKQAARFVNEEVVYDFALWGNATYAAGGYYYIILDQNLVSTLEKQQLDWTDAFERTFKTLTHEPVSHKIGPFSTLQNDLADAVANKAAWTAKTLDSLALQLKLDPQKLDATIKQYNEFTANKKDDLFYKSSQFLSFKVEQGPFYALKACSTSLGTIGGIETNENMEVLDQKSNIIKGAYATGNNASGMYDTSYPTLEGISCAFAWNSGRIAGESAANILN
ncbi:fumarate reductase (flavoprotein) [Liquorilactobacillus aquaticus DSM 21051]|uniref:Fumarate reductase (Flavoprotein) n=1 Tax=Liquorilactobacillus aquaticus DSM 21051 TaxID=1423725 RepID=A0A0R2CUB1_9LACO|nr:FAD-dependent oxidoreductase [Liquorilactobacillus aquaticus]KRM95352.1 fumarate reductase (flavoprotein) [Liquorilactobacillus aquaticus DSM 21051]